MKILVAVKRVIDPYVKVRINSEASGVLPNKMAMNPFDEIALEAAIRLKELGHATEIVAVTIGSQDSQETLRHALALGADSAIQVQTDDSWEPLNIAKILKALVTKTEASLVLMGKQAIDGDNNQTGQMLSALLGWPQATFLSKIAVEGEMLLVDREIDCGIESLQLQLPAVLTTDLRLNEPRYATLPNIMKAKRKLLDVLPLSELSLNLKSHTVLKQYTLPPQRPSGEMVESVEALVNKLRHEAKVL